MMLSPAATPVVEPLLVIVRVVVKPEPWTIEPKFPTKLAAVRKFLSRGTRGAPWTFCAAGGATWAFWAAAFPASRTGRNCEKETG
jgi:hypothetical protein